MFFLLYNNICEIRIWKEISESYDLVRIPYLDSIKLFWIIVFLHKNYRKKKIHLTESYRLNGLMVN